MAVLLLVIEASVIGKCNGSFRAVGRPAIMRENAARRTFGRRHRLQEAP